MKKKLILMLFVGIAGAALIVGPSFLAGSKSKTSGAQASGDKKNASATETVFSVRTEKAVRTTLQSYIEVNGDVVAETNVDVVPDAAGKLVTLKAEVGTAVRKGQLVAEVDPSKPGTSYSLSPVYAPISGTVTSAPLSVGATVSTATTIFAVGVMDKLEVQARIPERDVGRLKTGLKAQLTLEAFPGEKFAAVVERVSPVVDAATRSKQIVLAFEKQDERINAGMFARVKLDTATYGNRIAVSEEAVVALRGKTYLYILKSDSTVERREVKTGVTVGELTEIVEGIAENETVVTEGQQLLSDGAKVRVVNATGSRA